jgi:hypothetical protein
MGTVIIFQTNDSDVRCEDAVYANARAGTGTLTAANPASNLMTIGSHSESGGIFTCREGFISFDTSLITETPSIALYTEMSTSVFTGPGGAVGHLRVRDYGSSVETSDFVAGADLPALTLVARIAQVDQLPVDVYHTWADVAMAANIVPGGITRLIGSIKAMEDNVAIGAGLQDSFSCRSSDYAGTATDPYMTLVVGPYSIVPPHYPGFDSRPL